MEKNNFEKGILKIKSIEGLNNSNVSYCPERGGIITSIKFGGKEILYLDEGTFRDTKGNVKGGVPILFPNAGPITESSDFPNLEQHGFARKSEWKNENTEEGFKETLVTDKETIKMYPYDFKFSVSGRFEKDGSFTMIQEIENKEENKDLPISMGLHPYFKVPNNRKGDIKFNFEGGKFIEGQVETWANGKAVSVDNPKIKDPCAVMEINMPSLGTLTIDASLEYKKIWIWSMPDKDFVCIEPVMRNKNGLVEDPKKIKPKETFLASVNFKFKE